MTVPRLAMILGDPAGIGPEIASRLLAEAANREKAAVLLVADRTELEAAFDMACAMAARRQKRGERGRPRKEDACP